jgi:hypothetical protein
MDQTRRTLLCELDEIPGHTQLVGQASHAPVRRLLRPTIERRLQNILHLRIVMAPWLSAARRIRQTCQSILNEPPTSQRIRKRIEEPFGWTKEIEGWRQTKLRGLERVRQGFLMVMAGCNRACQEFCVCER